MPRLLFQGPGNGFQPPFIDIVSNILVSSTIRCDGTTRARSTIVLDMRLSTPLSIALRAAAGKAKPVLDRPPNCSAHPFDWVLFVLSLVILCVLWWAVEIPTLFVQQEARTTAEARRPWRNRFRVFFTAVAWNCVRLLQPSYVAIVAMARTRDHPRNWPRLYYFGYEKGLDDEEFRPQFTRGQWTKVALTDGLQAVVEILLIYRGSVISRQQQNPVWLGAWLLATLPTSLLGLHLIVVSRLPEPPRRFLVGLYAFLTLSVVGAGLIVAVVFGAAPDTYGRPLAGALATAWATIMVPLPTMYCCFGRFHSLFYLFAAFARISLLLMDLLRSRDTFPFCSINHPALVAVVGVFGGVLVLLFGLRGGTRCEQYRWNLERLIDVSPRGQAPQGDLEEQVALQGGENGPAQEPRPAATLAGGT